MLETLCCVCCDNAIMSGEGGGLRQREMDFPSAAKEYALTYCTGLLSGLCQS